MNSLDHGVSAMAQAELLAGWRYHCALVTGASSGLGREFALQLARLGCRVVLVARREEQLTQLAAKIRSLGGAAEVVVADLLCPEDRSSVVAAMHEFQVDLLINNAGVGRFCEFGNQALSDVTSQVQLNCLALAEMAHCATKFFLANGIRGGIMNIASLAAFSPVPGALVYGATKAFVLSLSESLAFELRPAGIQVAVVCPGPTESEFFDHAGTAPSAAHLMPANKCVAIALAAFNTGKTVINVGLTIKVAAVLMRALPHGWLLPIINRIVKAKA